MTHSAQSTLKEKCNVTEVHLESEANFLNELVNNEYFPL